jgi:hypothetical protein
LFSTPTEGTDEGPAEDKLEDHVLPSVDRIVETVSKAL